MARWRWTLIAALSLALALSAALLHGGDRTREPAEGDDLIGRELPDWGDLRFLDRPHRRSPEDFRGRVLVIRFWTGGCPFCETSAPVLSEWARRGRERGLVILGLYHPKPPRRVRDAEVRRLARALEFDAVLAVDDDWSALEKLWLRGQRRSFTSSSLLVGRDGTVRAVHAGGNLTPRGSAAERRAHAEFAAALERALDEPE